MRQSSLFITLLLLLAISAFAQPRTRKTYVLCVGVGDYADPRIQDLTKPTCDADTVATLFGINNAETVVLKDSMATGDNIRREMRRLFSKATINDNVLFFFSGHGISSGFCAHDYFQSTRGAVFYDDIKDIFRQCKAHGRIIMADACYSGKIRTKKDSTEVIAPLERNRQVMLFLSSRGSEVSYESPSMKNGYFTTYLAEALRGAADSNHNGKITAIELYNYVSAKLRVALGNRQHSVMWGNFNRGWILSRVLPQ